MRPNEPPPRLLLVANQAGDVLGYRLPLLDALRRAAFEVHLAVPPEPAAAALAEHGYPVHAIPLRRLNVGPRDELRTLAALLRLYRSLRPALVHHLCLKPVLHGGIAARLARVPSTIGTLTGLGPIFTRRSPDMRALRPLVSAGLRFACAGERHVLVVQNPSDRDRLVASRIARPDRTVVIGGSGVDPTLFTPRPEPEGPPAVLLACRLLREKGVEDFVAAAGRLRAGGHSARFVLSGEPVPEHPDSVPLAAIAALRDSGLLEWHGWSGDMPALFARSHIVCLPSYYGEGLPRVLLEAAASGRPIVTTDTPGCRDVVRHGWNGLLVPARDPEALAGAIATLIEKPELRAVMGARGRAMVLAKFTLTRVIDEYVALHRAVIEAPGAAAAASPGVIAR